MGVEFCNFVLGRPSPSDGHIYVFLTCCPKEILSQKIRLYYYADKNVSNLFTNFAVGAMASQLGKETTQHTFCFDHYETKENKNKFKVCFSQLLQDIGVWNQKIFIRKPVIVDGDGHIMKYRNWHNQFYQNSTKNGRGKNLILQN